MDRGQPEFLAGDGAPGRPAARHAEIVTDPDPIAVFRGGLYGKYKVEYPPEFFDPAGNASVRVTPTWAFALDEDDGAGSPTRWRFPEG